MFQKLAVKGEGTFELPKGKLATIFDFERNVSVLEPSEAGPWKKDGTSYAVTDSVHLPVYKGEEAQGKAIRDLLKRNGAKLLTPA